jgi:hypothetical protein
MLSVKGFTCGSSLFHESATFLLPIVRSPFARGKETKRTERKGVFSSFSFRKCNITRGIPITSAACENSSKPALLLHIERDAVKEHNVTFRRSLTDVLRSTFSRVVSSLSPLPVSLVLFITKERETYSCSSSHL